MKRALIVIALILFITLPASAQEYWNLKTAFDGMVVLPADSNGIALGGGVRVLFGKPDGSFDIGFEVSKWFRTYDLKDSTTGALIDSSKLDGTLYDDQLERDQQVLQFSVLTRVRFFSLFDNSLDLYSGLGGGFYFLQEKRQEARRNPLTGLWDVVKVDNYLDTKAQTFITLGFNGSLFNNLDLFAEYRFTYVYDWDRWEDPYANSLGLGLKYEF